MNFHSVYRSSVPIAKHHCRFEKASSEAPSWIMDRLSSRADPAQGLAEYRKKLLSQGVLRPEEARWGSLIRRAHGAGLLYTVRRMLMGS